MDERVLGQKIQNSITSLIGLKFSRLSTKLGKKGPNLLGLPA